MRKLVTILLLLFVVMVKGKDIRLLNGAIMGKGDDFLTGHGDCLRAGDSGWWSDDGKIYVGFFDFYKQPIALRVFRTKDGRIEIHIMNRSGFNENKDVELADAYMIENPGPRDIPRDIETN